jgi:hypothetical protein
MWPIQSTKADGSVRRQRRSHRYQTVITVRGAMRPPLSNGSNGEDRRAPPLPNGSNGGAASVTKRSERWRGHRYQTVPTARTAAHLRYQTARVVRTAARPPLPNGDNGEVRPARIQTGGCQDRLFQECKRLSDEVLVLSPVLAYHTPEHRTLPRLSGTNTTAGWSLRRNRPGTWTTVIGLWGSPCANSPAEVGAS